MADRYDALIVREKDGRSYFTKIGAMFANRNGGGFTLMLDALPLTGEGGQARVLLSVPKPRDGARQQSQSSSPAFDDDDSVPF